jgi:hypothetical protein
MESPDFWRCRPRTLLGNLLLSVNRERRSRKAGARLGEPQKAPRGSAAPSPSQTFEGSLGASAGRRPALRRAAPALTEVHGPNALQN